MSGPGSFSLEGQTAIVTGANTGIGQAIAVAMAEAGARIAAVGRSPMDETAALVGGGPERSVQPAFSQNRRRVLMIQNGTDAIDLQHAFGQRVGLE